MQANQAHAEKPGFTFTLLLCQSATTQPLPIFESGNSHQYTWSFYYYRVG